MDRAPYTPVQEPGRPRYPLYTAKEVAALWPRVEWLVNGVIQRNSAVLLYGESRIGKSFLALDLAVKLACGSDWFGYPVTKSRVIFYAAESPSGLPLRIKAHAQWNGQEVPDDLQFMNAVVDLSRPEDIEKLIATVQGCADIVFIDTLNAAAAEIDENSSKEMGRVLAGVRRVVAEAGCSVVLVHHCGWSDHDRPRGHSSLNAAADTRILVSRDSGHPSWRIKGQREGANTEAHRYALRVIELPEGIGTSCAVEPLQTDPAQKIHPAAASKHQRVVLSVAEDCLKGPDGTMLKADDIISRAAPIIEATDRHRRLRAAEGFNGLLKQGLLRVSDEGFVSLVR